LSRIFHYKPSSYGGTPHDYGTPWRHPHAARVAKGALLLEDQCSWAVPGSFTAAEKDNQVPAPSKGEEMVL